MLTGVDGCGVALRVHLFHFWRVFMSKRSSFRVAGCIAATLAGLAFLAAPARAQVSMGNFDNNSLAGWGALTNAGITPWAAPVNGAIVTGSVGSTAGSNVL